MSLERYNWSWGGRREEGGGTPEGKHEFRGVLAAGSPGWDPNVSPQSWVGRNLGDLESHWLGSTRGTSESSIGVEREVPCCSVSQECSDEVPLVDFRSIRYPGEMPIHFMGPWPALPICILA